MPSSTASSTPRTALPSTARPCANRRKKPPSVESLTLTPPSEPLKLSMGATVRDHRNAVRDRSESLSAIDRNHCLRSSESPGCASSTKPGDARAGAILSYLYGHFGLVRLCRLGHDVPWVKA